jgi:hypothetical protein
MTEKQIADKLRYVAEYNLSYTHLTDLADELDPPRPEPGTVVWWTDANELSKWSLGIVVSRRQIEILGSTARLSLDSVKWKPVRIARPGQVVVDVPPVRDWDSGANEIWLAWQPCRDNFRRFPIIYTGTKITRAEAEHMEGEK